MRIINQNCYDKTPINEKPRYRKEFELRVVAVLDGVKGPFNDERDLMNWIVQNPYVRFVALSAAAE